MLTFRNATAGDLLLYFDWANDKEVRQQSYQTDPISLKQHSDWFLKKISDPECIMLLFEDKEKNAVGQIRFQKENEDVYIIGISLAKEQRGKGYAAELLKQSSDYFLQLKPAKIIHAFIKKENIASIRSFANAGFMPSEEISDDEKSVLYTKQQLNENS